MCVGVNTSSCPLAYELVAQLVLGPCIHYLNWVRITACWEEAALLFVDRTGLGLHTPSCHMRNKGNVVYYTPAKSCRRDWHEKTVLHVCMDPQPVSHFNCTSCFFKRQMEFCQAVDYTE